VNRTLHDDETRKLSSNLAKRMRLRSLRLWERCHPLGQTSARLDGGVTGAMRLRQALAGYIDQGNKTFVSFYQVLLAEIEAQGDSEGALTRIDEALALARETGEHWSDAFMHRCAVRFCSNAIR
jgi:hypothetical protein